MSFFRAPTTISTPSMSSTLSNISIQDMEAKLNQIEEQSKAKQSKAKQSKAKQSKAKQSKAKQSKAKQSKAKQSKAKQSKALNLEREKLKTQFDEKNAEVIKKIKAKLDDMQAKCDFVSKCHHIPGDDSAVTYKAPDFSMIYIFEYLSGKNNTLEKLHQEIEKKWPEYLDLLHRIPYAATRYSYSDLLAYFKKIFEGRDVYLDDHPAAQLNEEQARLQEEKKKIEKQIEEQREKFRTEAARQQDARRLQAIKEMEEKLGFDSLLKNIDREKIKVQKEICVAIVQCERLHNAPDKFDKASLENFVNSDIQNPSAINDIFVARYYGIGIDRDSYFLGQKRDHYGHYGWGEVVRSHADQLTPLVRKLEAWDELKATLEAKSTHPEKRLEQFKNGLKQDEAILGISFDQLNCQQQAASAFGKKF